MNDAMQQDAKAYTYCAYCPKVCRFSCPVSEVTRSETTSAWGKMTHAYLIRSSQRPVDQGSSEALYACTGCMRCRSFCAHDNEVGLALFAAREAALESRVAPSGAAGTVETFRAHGNPFGPGLADSVGQLASLSRTGGFPLFPGCSAVLKSVELIHDLAAIGSAISFPFELAPASRQCCGYPLYAAGDASGFRKHAENTARSLADDPELVVLDPGCAYTFATVYPRHGIKLRTRIRTLTSTLAQRLPVKVPEPLTAKVRYLDACHLSRGLGEYEAPRLLLRRATRWMFESSETRAEASCSGGGGLLPRTMPDASIAMAKRLAVESGDKGVTLVTACTTSVRQLIRAGQPATHLISFLRSWLGA